MVRAAVLLAAVALAGDDPVSEGVRQQSCTALTVSTVGLPDQVQADGGPGITAAWPDAPAGLPDAVPLRTETETFNRRYEFVTRDGAIHGRNRDSGDPWRTMPLPAIGAR